MIPLEHFILNVVQRDQWEDEWARWNARYPEDQSPESILEVPRSLLTPQCSSHCVQPTRPTISCSYAHARGNIFCQKVGYRLVWFPGFFHSTKIVRCSGGGQCPWCVYVRFYLRFVSRPSAAAAYVGDVSDAGSTGIQARALCGALQLAYAGIFLGGISGELQCRPELCLRLCTLAFLSMLVLYPALKVIRCITRRRLLCCHYY